MKSARLLLSFGVSLSLLAMVGCAGMPPLPGFPGFQAEPTTNVQQIPPHIPTATVVMIEDGAEPVAAQLPLTEVTYVQAALDKTGLSDRFMRMNVELIRPLETGRHKVSIPYDRTTHSIKPEYDYALQPGDKLVVRQDTTTMLDDMLDSLTPF